MGDERVHEFVTKDGERIRVRTVLESVICPVCGWRWPDTFHPMNLPDSHEVCECNVQFGFDDAEPQDIPLMTRWARLRIEWLIRQKWSDDCINQLREGLGLTFENLLKELGEYADDVDWMNANMKRSHASVRRMIHAYARNPDWLKQL